MRFIRSKFVAVLEYTSVKSSDSIIISGLEDYIPKYANNSANPEICN